MEPLIAMKPDALIMADPGFDYDRARKMAGNADSPVRTGEHHQLLGREILAEHRRRAHHPVARIEHGRNRRNPARMPDIELEVFIHGALCIAYSGRCLLSGYFNHRDPNQGTCTNSCRWDYKVHNATESDAGDAQLLQGFNFESPEEANQNFRRHQRPETPPLRRQSLPD